VGLVAAAITAATAAAAEAAAIAAEAATAFSAEATTTATAAAAAEAATTAAAAAEAATVAAAAAEAAATLAAAAAEAAAITTPEGGTILARTGNIDLQGTTHEVSVFSLSDSSLGCLVGRHRDEGEAACAASEFVAHDFHRGHFAILSEVVADVVFRGCPRKVADEQFVFHVFSFLVPTPHCPFPTLDFKLPSLATDNPPASCGVP
jgi:nucleoid-associated protein YgaU